MRQAAKGSSCKNSLSRNKISRFLWCGYAQLREELLAHKKSSREMCTYIKAKKFKIFKSRWSFTKALTSTKRTQITLQFSDHYFHR